MILNDKTPRRGFLGSMVAAAAAISLPWTGGRAAGAATQAGHDDWIDEVRGSHKCLFDFPSHKMGFPLLHIFNYTSTYASAYEQGNEQVGTVGTFYGMGGASSIPMGFNDSIWAKYELGVYTGLDDANGRVVHAQRVQPRNIGRCAPPGSRHSNLRISGCCVT